MKKVKIFGYLISIVIPFIFMNNVSASTSFTTCTFTENSYLRSTPGGNKITDTDGSTFLINSPRRAEVIDSTTTGGKSYKKLKINYYSNNYIGWVWDGYLKDFKTYTTSDEYANSLRNAGFPETYILPLAKLKAVYPNWNFIVSKNGSGLDWNTVINSEYSPVYKNLLCSNNLEAIKPLLSTDGSVYNAGTYKKFDNGTCYAPSKQTISFYMDPRNWFNDNTIFMFEQLSFNEALHTTSTVQPMLNNTFMAGSYGYNGGTISYAQTFVNSGKQNNVSPVQLTSRVLQEQGTTGSATINMKDGGKTYYNFFNVGASGNSESELIANALATAKSRGWDNPYSSIVGGASLISNGYTKVGQDTNYYQKFNTINNSSLYINQYMANVRVNPSEAISMYSTYYKNNLLNSSFTFKIPVYNNMPDATTLSTTQNADNTLASLTVSNCKFTQEFNSTVTTYYCDVANNVSSVNVTAKATSAFSSVSGTGTKSLSVGNNPVQVKVTAANGDIKIYTVNINRAKQSQNPTSMTPADVISSLGLNNDNNVVSGIQFGTSIQSVISAIKSQNATVTVLNKNNQSKTSGVIATEDKLVISINNKETTFIVSIKGDVSSDGNIDISDLAMVKAKMLNKVNLSNAPLKSADINHDGNVDISDLAMIKAHMLGKIVITK